MKKGCYFRCNLDVVFRLCKLDRGVKINKSDLARYAGISRMQLYNIIQGKMIPSLQVALDIMYYINDKYCDLNFEDPAFHIEDVFELGRLVIPDED